jgi:hypothetical protein
MDAIEEQFTLLSLGLLTIAVRIGVRTRSVGISGWQLDDYLMPFTGVSCTKVHLLVRAAARQHLTPRPSTDHIDSSFYSLPRQSQHISSERNSRALRIVT